MRVVIIGDGLTSEIISPENQFINLKSNIGGIEIQRLMGRGRNFGRGPLPIFLRAVEAARQDGAPVNIILLKNICSAEGLHNIITSEDVLCGFIEPLKDIAAAAEIVDTPPDQVPWLEISEKIESVVGQGALSDSALLSESRVLLLGCHTEKRILALATYFKNFLNFSEVAVSPHLTASSDREAHMSAFRNTFHSHGVKVLLDLEETAEYAGIEPSSLVRFNKKPCLIEPQEARELLNEERRRVIELLCLHWTKTNLRPLQGGFSGSLLFLAEGWKMEASTEPMVIKIDNFNQMRREIEGYHQVKDLLGKHIPSFGNPVANGDSIGVAMEFAAMAGAPETIQDTFEVAESEDEFDLFFKRLDNALDLISVRLYSNTSRLDWFSPYRRFGLHTKSQLKYLELNLSYLEEYLNDEKGHDVKVDRDFLLNTLKLITANEDALESETCVAHGDLNFQNLISDQSDNIWLIDWTHCGRHPLEKDFAKLESDAKFVLSKNFEVEDLPRLRKFEEYLLSVPIPADERNLPGNLNYVKWDLRYRAILSSVRSIREKCFALKQDNEWLIYRIALLAYTLHTLSFDQRRGRGECGLPQLGHAYLSAKKLLFDLVSDDFHMRIRGERPSSYPVRQRISIDQAPWSIPCPEYDPPYHVDPEVIAHDYQNKVNGWAQPEKFEEVQLADTYKYKDDIGRPMHPRGRTGIAGRGLLGRWGPNPAVAAIALRKSTSGRLEVLLGKKESDGPFFLPQGFIRPGEETNSSITAILEEECGWRPSIDSTELVFEGFSYDPRQTDNAWLEVSVYLLLPEINETPAFFQPSAGFEEASWQPFIAQTINEVAANQTHYLRKAVRRLAEKGIMQAEEAEDLLRETG